MKKEAILVTVFILFVTLALVQESHGIGGILTPRPKWRRSRRRTHFYGGGGNTRRLVPIIVVTDRKIKLESLFRCVDMI